VGFQLGDHRIARAVSVAKKLDLALDPRGSVRPDVEFPFGRRVPETRVRNLDRVLATGLPLGNFPRVAQHALLLSHDARGHRIAFRSGDFHQGAELLLFRPRLLRAVMQNHASHIQFLLGAIDGLISAQMGQIPVGAAQRLGCNDPPPPGGGFLVVVVCPSCLPQQPDRDNGNTQKQLPISGKSGHFLDLSCTCVGFHHVPRWDSQ
jgi:hypothetical protein